MVSFVWVTGGGGEKRRVTKPIFRFQGNASYSEAAFNPEAQGTEWQWVLLSTPSERVGWGAGGSLAAHPGGSQVSCAAKQGTNF